MKHHTFATLLLAGAAFSLPAMAETIHVHPGDSIQSAVNRAAWGDTVAVHRGVYTESVIFRGSGITLLSADGVGAAQIKSDGTPLIVFGGRNKTVSGFRLSAGTGGNGMQLIGTVSQFDQNFVIENNTITTDGEDGIKVHQVRGLKLAGNTIGNAGTGNAGTSSRQTRLELGIGGVGDNIGNTDEDVWRAIENGEAGAWRRLENVLSGDGVTRQINRTVDGATGLVTDAVDDTIDTATDTVLQPVEDTVDGIGQAISCSVGGSILGGVGTVASGIFGRGKATLGAQIAQYATQTAGNLCLGRSLTVQRQILDYERRNNANGTADNAAGVDGLMARTLPGLGQGGFLSSEPEIRGVYEDAYPDLFPPLTAQDLIDVDGALRQHERQAHLGSFALQNRVVREQAGSLNRAREYAAAGRDGQGIRSELQAMNAIGGETIASINNLTAATVGSNRAAAEVQIAR